MIANRWYPEERHSDPLSSGLGLGIEIEHHLHVIANESERYHRHRRHSVMMQGLQMLVDIRFQPRKRRGAAAALIDQVEADIGQAGLDHYQLSCLQELARVVAAGGH